MSQDAATHQQSRTQQRRIDEAQRRGSRVIEWPSKSGAVPKSWDLSWTSAAVAAIAAGTLRVHGRGKYECSGSVSLTGATEWIYVKRLRGASSATIQHQATEPDDSGSSDIMWPLYKLERLADGSYQILRDCREDGHL